MSQNNYPRKLLIVPILHTKEDMGSLASALSSGVSKQVPPPDYLSFASAFWEEVRKKVEKCLDSFQKIKVYQDGLPNTGKKVVNKVINEVKSPNYQLLRFLKNKGAKILGTEDPKLLKKEYQLVSQILKASDEESKNKARQVYKKQAEALLVKRDGYIAKRIDNTLKKGDLGILFIGAAHQIKDKLPKDVQVETL